MYLCWAIQKRGGLICKFWVIAFPKSCMQQHFVLLSKRRWRRRRPICLLLCNNVTFMSLIFMATFIHGSSLSSVAAPWRFFTGWWLGDTHTHTTRMGHPVLLLPIFCRAGENSWTLIRQKLRPSTIILPEFIHKKSFSPKKSSMNRSLLRLHFSTATTIMCVRKVCQILKIL